MNVLAIILAIAAVALFLLEALARTKLNCAAIGLALFVTAWIVQLVSVSHPIHT